MSPSTVPAFVHVDLFAGRYSTTYLLIGAPPSCSGACHSMSAEFSVTLLTGIGPVGADGLAKN